MRANIIIVFLLVISAGPSLGLECTAVKGVPELTKQVFVDKALAITDAIQNAWLETLTYPQLALGNLVASPIFPGRTEFDKFAAGNKNWNPQKTIGWLQWAPKVSNPQRDAFETAAQSEIPDFHIFSFQNGDKQSKPPNSSSAYYPILYCSPADPFILGLDLNDDVEGPAITRAMTSGQPTTAEPFMLRGDTPGTLFKTGMTMYMPVYMRDGQCTSDLTPPTTASPPMSPADFYGSLVAVFIFHPMVSHVLQSMSLDNLDVFLFWVEDKNGTNVSTYVAHFESAPDATRPMLDPTAAPLTRVADIAGDIVTNFTSSFDVRMVDRVFRVCVRARKGTVPKDVVLSSKRSRSQVLQKCSKMTPCVETVQGTPAVIVAEDDAAREITYRVLGRDAAPCAPRGRVCNMTVLQRVAGLYIVEVFADGQQITDSPVLINVTVRSCEAPRVASEDGECICNLNTDFRVGDSCVSFSVLFPAIILPAACLITVLGLFYLSRRLAEEEVQWRIDPKELVFSDPEEVLGSGTQGDVIRATYRGTPVAVKRFRVGAPRRASSEGRAPLPAAAVGLEAGGDFMSLHGKGRGAAAGESNLAGGSGVVGGGGGAGGLVAVSSAAAGMRASRGRGATYKQLKKDMKTLTAMRHPAITTLMGIADLGAGGAAGGGASDGAHAGAAGGVVGVGGGGGLRRRVGLCMVMELMELGSLWDLLHNKTFPITGKLALQFLQDIARGMRFLHEAKPPLLHGDLKSGNVLVDRSFCGKISDFGLSLYQRNAEGTSLWMSPECLRGSTTTPQSDVWSFGVIIHELLTRQCPYEGDDAARVLSAIASGARRLPPPPGCSVEVAAVLGDCLAHDPPRRPPFAELDRRLGALDVALMTSPVFADEAAISLSSIGPSSGKRLPDIEEGVQRERKSSLCSEEILADLFPAHVASALMRGEKVPPEHKEMMTMFFSDIVGFTTMSATLPAAKVSGLLDRLFDRLDAIAERLGVYKIETIGDAYLCATNIVADQARTHAAVMARFSVEAMRAANSTPVDEDDPSRGFVQFRVGLASGPCMASVVGRRCPKYTLFGDTINTASRMESNSFPGRIQCTARTADMIRQQDPAVRLEHRGVVEIKGKGPMVTYWILPDDDAQASASTTPMAVMPMTAPAKLELAFGAAETWLDEAAPPVVVERQAS